MTSDSESQRPKLRAKAEGVGAGITAGWPACFSRAASWAWRAASSAVNEAVEEIGAVEEAGAGRVGAEDEALVEDAVIPTPGT